MSKRKQIIIFLIVWFVFSFIVGEMGALFHVPIPYQRAYMDIVASIVPVLFLLFLSAQSILQCRKHLREEGLQSYERRSLLMSCGIDLVRYAAFLAAVLFLFLGAYFEDIKPIPERGNWYFTPTVLLFAAGFILTYVLELVRLHLLGNRVSDLETAAFQESLKQDETLHVYHPDEALRKKTWRRVRWRRLSFWNGLIPQAAILLAGGIFSAMMVVSIFRHVEDWSALTERNMAGLLGAAGMLLMAWMFSLIGVAIKRAGNFSKYLNEVVWIDETGNVVYCFDLFKGSARRAWGMGNPTGRIAWSCNRETISAVTYDPDAECLVFHFGKDKQYLFGYFEHWEELVREVQTAFGNKMTVSKERFWMVRSGLELAALPIMIAFCIILGTVSTIITKRREQSIPWNGMIHTEEIRQELDELLQLMEEELDTQDGTGNQ